MVQLREGDLAAYLTQELIGALGESIRDRRGGLFGRRVRVSCRIAWLQRAVLRLGPREVDFVHGGRKMSHAVLHVAIGWITAGCAGVPGLSSLDRRVAVVILGLAIMVQSGRKVGVAVLQVLVVLVTPCRLVKKAVSLLESGT